MSQGDMILAWQQHQEYIANQKFESDAGFIKEPVECQDAYISEEEREAELCSNSQQPSQSYVESLTMRKR